MRKLDEILQPESCWNRATPNELVFVLLGRDVAAPATILRWCEERIMSGKNTDKDPQIIEATELARAMERERGGPETDRRTPEQYRYVARLHPVVTAFVVIYDGDTRQIVAVFDDEEKARAFVAARPPDPDGHYHYEAHGINVTAPLRAGEVPQ